MKRPKADCDRSGRISRFVLFCGLSVFGGMAACGDGAPIPAVSDPALPPAWDALATMPSAAGSWRVSVWTWPQPAIKGTMDIVYRVVDMNGLAGDGLGLEVMPWMPAHAHGTNPTTVTPEGDGYYLVKPVYLYMSGQWQLRTTIGGSASDTVTPVVDVP